MTVIMLFPGLALLVAEAELLVRGASRLTLAMVVYAESYVPDEGCLKIKEGPRSKIRKQLLASGYGAWEGIPGIMLAVT